MPIMTGKMLWISMEDMKGTQATREGSIMAILLKANDSIYIMVLLLVQERFIETISNCSQGLYDLLIMHRKLFTLDEELIVKHLKVRRK